MLCLHVLCLAYVDPLEEKDSSENFIYMLKAMILKWASYHAMVLPRQDFDEDGAACIKKLLNDKLHFEKQISTPVPSNLLLEIRNGLWLCMVL